MRAAREHIFQFQVLRRVTRTFSSSSLRGGERGREERGRLNRRCSNSVRIWHYLPIILANRNVTIVLPLCVRLDTDLTDDNVCAFNARTVDGMVNQVRTHKRTHTRVRVSPFSDETKSNVFMNYGVCSLWLAWLLSPHIDAVIHMGQSI